MAPACSSISLFPSAQTKNTRDGPTAAFPKDSILSRMGKPRIQPTISFVISFIPAWAGKLDAAHRQLGGDGPIPTHAGKTHSHSLPPITTLAHPRSRGENSRATTARCWSCGSSPLTRGKLLQAEGHALVAGLIPAHAGKTRPDPAPRRLSAAHPRSRGENFNRVQGRRSCRGSSPLTRGKLPTLSNSSRQRRLIPAHAGKTVELVPVVPGRTAHPRSRGENRTLSLMICISVGSSPLTRGKPASDRGHGTAVGLIPAHAGKTS